MASSTSSTSSTCSWSDLPLDVLLTIRELLQQRSDIVSFRSVCSHWRSATPVANPCPQYIVRDLSPGCIDIAFIRNGEVSHSIDLPFPRSHGLVFFCTSNGWIVFCAANNSFHLFDPVSSRKHSFPPLTSIMIHSANRSAARVTLMKAVVSSRPDNGVAVAGIALLQSSMGYVLKKILVYCKSGKRQRWSCSKENSGRILDVIAGRDGRHFYAVDAGWDLYALQIESPARWKKFNLWLPKHMLCDHGFKTKRLAVEYPYMRETAGGQLKVYGFCEGGRDGRGWMALKADAAKLRADSREVNVVCEANGGLGHAIN